MTHVLIVDGSAMVRRMLAAALAREGFGVTTASDCSRARRLVAVAPPDIVVLDGDVASGLELVRAVKRSRGAAAYVVVLAANDGLDARAACRRAGADAVFGKPVAVSTLRRRLDDAARALASRAAQP